MDPYGAPPFDFGSPLWEVWAVGQIVGRVASSDEYLGRSGSTILTTGLTYTIEVTGPGIFRVTKS